MEQHNQAIKGLPANAFRLLKEGESYIPLVTDADQMTEVSWRSIIFGLMMTIIFSAASGFIALKTGQGIETAIPIAIIAVGFSALFFKRKNTILENINILAIGATASGAIGGVVFTLPALWILGLENKTSFFQIFLVALLGTVLGILLLIPFRRYFVAEMHGKFPFPEGTATTEILVAGEKGSKQALVLAYSLAIGFIYDTFLLVAGAWREVVSTSIVKAFNPFTNKLKIVCNMYSSAAMAGLGYIIGLRYAAIILSGSLLAWWVLVPAFNWLGGFIDVPISNSGAILAEGDLIRQMTANDIFSNYVRYIGIGGIFTAGIFSILKLWKVIYQALTVGLKGLLGSLGKGGAEEKSKRTDRDIAMPKVLLMLLLVAAITFFYYYFSVLAATPNAFSNSLISLLLVLIVSFLFAAVSAWAIAMISVTPISGMTATTLIITGVVMSKLGLTGETGMLAAILIGGVVCTALAMAGTMVTEFKVAYWVGATPKSVQWWNIIGAFVAAVVAALVIILLAKSYGYVPGPDHPRALPAPQANAMAAVIKGLLSSGEAPWLLYGLGAVVAIVIEFVGVSSLAFALGMYLPIELNTPIFLGALVAWYLKKTAKNEKEAAARNERGNLIASGLIAGGGLAGIASAFLLFFEIKIPSFGNTGSFGNFLGLFLFIALLIYIYFDCKSAKVEE